MIDARRHSRKNRWLWALIFGAFGFLAVGGSIANAAAPSLRPVRMFGVDYIDARAFGQRFGLVAAWSVPQRTLRLKSATTVIELTVHSVETSLNGILLFLSEPVVLRQGQLYLSKGDVESLFAPILAPTPARIPKLRTIAIDAGHGGNDPGNQNRSLKLDEKRLTLDVARRLQRLLTARGHRVIMTRTSDRAVDLEKRTALANAGHADLFISIHFNAFRKSAIMGVETYIMTPHRVRSTPQAERDRRMAATRYPSNADDDWNALLGYRVHRSLVHSLRAPDRGLKRFRFSVLRTIECPAVLVEAGFLSNSKEAHKSASAAYRQQIAEAIASGVRHYGTSLETLRRSSRKSG